MVGIDEEDIDLLDFSGEAGKATPTQLEDTSTKRYQASTRPHDPASTSTKGRTLPVTPSGRQDTSQLSSRSTMVRATPVNLKPRETTQHADFAEEYTGLRVRNRLLSAEDMRIRMKGRVVHRLSSLRSVPLAKLQSQDLSDAWATVGVLVSKSPRRQGANGGSFSVWTLSDLDRKENDLSVFLFQEALNSHWTVCEGTLLAVVGPKVLPPKGNGENRLAVSVDTPWQVRNRPERILLDCVTCLRNVALQPPYE